MSSNTKIVVLRSKELVYALVLIIISVVIIMTAVSLFAPQKESATAPSSGEAESEESTQAQSEASQTVTSQAIYTPGIYTAAIKLGNVNAELQITVDADRINSISLANLDESVTTLYPLMQPTLEELSASILESQSLEGISYDDENRYTSMLLLQAISTTLDKAAVQNESGSLETDAATGAIY